MGYRTLADPAFDRTLTLRDAYLILEQFVLEYEARGDQSVSAFHMYLGIAPDGVSGDPAAIPDFLAVSARVLGPPSKSSATS